MKTQLLSRSNRNVVENKGSSCYVMFSSILVFVLFPQKILEIV